ncbi:MAG: DotH/IcmK family type IV secretion protein [Alphaproteobacteria bacterium]|nr:DotH/IcmK family type IV secretion protein [Alphaproteobacteria bacterium]
MFELIRGCQLLYGIGRKIIVSAVLGTVVGLAQVAVAPVVMAADTPQSLSDKVRAAVGDKLEDGKKGTDKKTDESLVKASTADGISLTDVPPVSAALEDQLNQERLAEEAAAKALVDEQKAEEDHNRKSFKRASEGLMPLSPDQIRAFMQKLESTQSASVAPSSGTPKGEVKVASLSLDPGGDPPQINLSPGFVTTIDIIDQTGEPWPIADVGVGGNFEVTPTQAGSHVVRVVPLTRVGTGNLSILLKDLSTPIIFRLSTGGSTFHMRFDARVPQIGPNAKTPLIKYRRTGPVAGDAVISMVLENAPPKEAKRLKVGGVDARTMAWQIGGKVFVRTPLSLLSPAWNASASSSDGMTVYEIGDAPVLLMSDNGAMIRARLLREETNDK